MRAGGVCERCLKEGWGRGNLGKQRPLAGSSVYEPNSLFCIFKLPRLESSLSGLAWRALASKRPRKADLPQSTGELDHTTRKDAQTG